MKVALLSDGIWPYVLGGMQKHSYYLCKYLARAGVEVHLVHFNQSEYRIEDLEFFSPEEKKFIRATTLSFPSGPKFPGHYLYYSYRYSKSCFGAIEANITDYDFIYCKGFTAWHLLKVKKRNKGKWPPVGVKFHGYEMFQKAPDLKTALQMRLLLRAPVKWISRNADAVFSYGGKITGIIQGLGVDRKKILELPSGIEASSVSATETPTHRPLRFLFLGRYERRKGVEELNTCLKLLIGKTGSPQFEMHFIGPIPKEKRIQNENLIYHGEIRDKNTLQQKMRDCDVLVCPSWSEGFPNVLLEAMGNGLSVLASDVGAIRVLVNAENGFLIGSSEPAAIKNGMLWFMNLSEHELQEKKKAALATVREKFTWEILSGQLLQYLSINPRV